MPLIQRLPSLSVHAAHECSPLLPAAPSGPVPDRDRQGASGPPAVCLRAEMGPSAARHSAAAESCGFLDVRVRDCRAELLTSTVTNIGPFLEDEFSVDSQPMKLHMSNITVTMKVVCSYMCLHDYIPYEIRGLRVSTIHTVWI